MATPRPRVSTDPEHEHLLDRAIELFQPRYDVPLTREDAREIAYNLTGFFNTLAEMRRKRDERMAAASRSPAPTDETQPEPAVVRPKRKARRSSPSGSPS